MTNEDKKQSTYLYEIVDQYNHKYTNIVKNEDFDFDKETYTKKEFNDLWDEMLMSSFGCQLGILDKAIQKLVSYQGDTNVNEHAIEILTNMKWDVHKEVGAHGVIMPSVSSEAASNELTKSSEARCKDIQDVRVSEKKLGYFEAMDKGMTFEEWMMS